LDRARLIGPLDLADKSAGQMAGGLRSLPKPVRRELVASLALLMPRHALGQIMKSMTRPEVRWLGRHCSKGRPLRERPIDRSWTTPANVLAGLVERVTYQNAENGFASFGSHGPP
jgi:hypothetical protein